MTIWGWAISTWTTPACLQPASHDDSVIARVKRPPRAHGTEHTMRKRPTLIAGRATRLLLPCLDYLIGSAPTIAPSCRGPSLARSRWRHLDHARAGRRRPVGNLSDGDHDLTLRRQR